MIRLYSPKEIEEIALGGAILSKCLKTLVRKAQIGTSLKCLDDLASQIIKENGAEPAFLGYQPGGAKKPYGAVICTSLNEVVVHGYPTDYKLKDGDLLKIDLGVKYHDFYTDAAVTLGIGNISKQAENLVDATQKSLNAAIKYAKVENHLGDLGFAVEKISRQFGFKVIKELVGHGVGKNLHEDPTIYNFGEAGSGIVLKEGMVLAIEPMLSAGDWRIIQKPDESWATSDGSLSAQFEHTVAVTKKGPLVLTKI